MNFSDLKISDTALKILKRNIKENRIASSYLFSGPKGAGKRDAAIVFAQILNCLQRDQENPCQHCRNCYKIEKGIHPEVRIIQVEENSKEIKKEQIEEIEKQAQLKPIEAIKKVYIFDDASCLTLESENSLLKILEEPPLDTIFILITVNPFNLLPTIRSRCQKIFFELVKEYKFSEEVVKIGEKLLDCANKENLSDFLLLVEQLKKENGILKSVIEFLLEKFRLDFETNPTLKKEKDIELLLDSLKMIDKNISLDIILGNIFVKIKEG